MTHHFTLLTVFQNDFFKLLFDFLWVINMEPTIRLVFYVLHVFK